MKFSIRCFFGRHAPGRYRVTFTRVDPVAGFCSYLQPFICPRCEVELPEPDLQSKKDADENLRGM